MTKSNRILVKRIYEDPSSSDGQRILVDRLWPRGVSKERAKLDLWRKEVSPSKQLRQWYGHDPEKFPEFERRYRSELEDDERSEALADLRKRASAGPVTLLTASKRDDISEATVLQRVLSGE